MSPAALFPSVSIAGVPPANCCLRHLHKKFEGRRVFKPATPYDCDGAFTLRSPTSITLIPLLVAPCDEQPSPIPDGSVLKSEGATIVRKDGLALFSGRFTISDPAGVSLFTGYMELMDRIGTHHEPFGTERCDQEYHFEGWLVGKGGKGYEDLLLRALVVGKADRLPDVAESGLYGFLNGVIVRVPKLG